MHTITIQDLVSFKGEHYDFVEQCWDTDQNETIFDAMMEEYLNNKDADDVDVPDAQVQDDPVNHPSHYTYGKIECIDYLDAIGVGYAFCRGNVIKYTTRLGHKIDDLEDAKKVVWYAQHIVDKLADGTYGDGGGA